MKILACLVSLCSALLASHAFGQQADIRLAVIGDSYTVGYGDSCNIQGNVCSILPPDNPAVWYSNNASNGVPQTLMQPCQIYFGWPAKLIQMLNQSGKRATLVAYCMKNGASTKEMSDQRCGATVAAASPTHTILFSGLNDGGPSFRKDTEYWAGQIGQQLATNGGGGKTIYLQGNGVIYPAYWQQSFQWGQFMGGVNTPCRLGHPDPWGYLSIAKNLATNPYIQW